MPYRASGWQLSVRYLSCQTPWTKKLKTYSKLQALFAMPLPLESTTVSWQLPRPLTQTFKPIGLLL